MEPRMIHPPPPPSLRKFVGLATLGSLALVPARGAITVEVSPGYALAWDGSEGLYFDSAVPDNWALAANGATAIASGQLWPWEGGPVDPENAYHTTANLNDGAYGNAHSWIGAEPEDGVTPYAGVLFREAVALQSFAFGRDNAASALDDRSSGTYTVQFTTDGSSWTSVGTITLSGPDEDTVPGGGFTSYLRHGFTLSAGTGDPLVASGLRLLVPGTGLAAGVAIDEIEVFGVAVIPEPAHAGVFLAALSLAALPHRRRR
jgi:hypothetical protein